MANNEGTALHGDRSAWNTTDYADEHARDINDAALLRHLPAPATANEIITSDGSNWTATLAPQFDGKVIIDITSTEAFLVRKNADGGDVFIVDTNTPALIAFTDHITLSDIETDAANKVVKIGSKHYTNAEQDVLIMSTQNVSGENKLFIGGVWSSHNTVSVIRFYTAATSTTTSGTERMRIMSNGRVGIGTTVPAGTLEITGTDNPFMVSAYGSDNAGQVGRKARGTFGSPTAIQSGDFLTFYAGRGYGTNVFSSNAAIVSMKATENWTNSAQGCNILLETTPNGSSAASRTERMRIDQTGDIGIGTMSPASQLHIDQASSSGAQPVLFLDQGDVSEQCIQFSSDAVDRDINLWTVNVTGTPKLTWDDSQDNLLFSKGITIGGASPTNATLFSIEDGITFKESSAPTADATYGKIWTTDVNELFFQSGDGTTHLLHGDAFANIWYHGSTTGSLTVDVNIATQNAMTIINSFTVVGNEDDLANVVGSSANNTLTLSSIAGGEYEVSFHASVTATGGADKQMVIALGIVLATAKDITDVTDDTVTPIVITSTGHGLEDGDMVEIVGVLGNTAAVGSFIVDGKTDNTFKIVKLDGTATTGNGNFDEGSPTGDITIVYPGNMMVHRMVRGADLGAVSATGLHVLANSDVLSLYVANLDGITDLTVGAVSFDAFRIGD